MIRAWLNTRLAQLKAYLGRRKAATLLSRLAPRERQIADLVAQGKPNKQIAFEVGLATGTVKQYLFHAMQKTRTSTRTELGRMVWDAEHKGRSRPSA